LKITGCYVVGRGKIARKKGKQKRELGRKNGGGKALKEDEEKRRFIYSN
jgi:hypothetical protein